MKDIRVHPLREAEAPGWEKTKAPLLCLVVLGIISIGILIVITVINFIRGAAPAANVNRNQILRVSHRRPVVTERTIQSLAK